MTTITKEQMKDLDAIALIKDVKELSGFRRKLAQYHINIAGIYKCMENGWPVIYK